MKHWYRQDPTTVHGKDAKHNNWTPLHYASENGHLEIVQFLLSNGAEVDAVDSDNVTPLLHAASRGHVPVDVVEALLDRGANINHQNNDKITPLHYAALGNLLPVVKILINRGADRSLKDRWKRTPLDLAKEFKIKSIVDYLSSL